MKKTLIVIDMQNDFIDGALGTKEAQKIIPRIQERIQEYQRNKDEVIFTRDTHHKDYLKTNEGKYLPVEHCIEGTKGWEISEKLSIGDAICINKPSFGYTGWKKHALEDVLLVGVCTDICVISNALLIKAFYPEIRVRVDASCCAGVTRKSHMAALETMKMCQVEVVEGV